MANPEHLAKLQEGVNAWNDWRRTSGVESPDLSDLDLERFDLWGANLHQTNLSESDLR